DAYWPGGVIVREQARVRSNWQSERDLDADLTAAGVVGIAGIDTRALTRRIAGAGQVAAGIFAGDDAQATDTELVTQVRNWSKPATEQLLAEVTTGTAYDVVAERPQHTVALIDLGVRRSTINQLVHRGNTVKVLP